MRFAYDGVNLIGEYNTSRTLLRRYVPGPGIDEPIVWYEGSGTSDRRWLATDELGSVVAVTNASGAATSINSYDEYGTPGSGNTGRVQYTGQAWLPEASLYHYKARAYSPTLGRFLQTDPILWAGGLNLYAYAANDPINNVDPYGLEEFSAIVVTGVRPSFGVHMQHAHTSSTAGGAWTESEEITVVGQRILRGDVPFQTPISDDGSTYTEAELDRLQRRDERICRGVNPAWSRACWESANNRNSARRTGRPVPPLETGRRPRTFTRPPVGGGGLFLIIPDWWSMCEGGDQRACDILGPLAPRNPRFESSLGTRSKLAAIKGETELG